MNRTLLIAIIVTVVGVGGYFALSGNTTQMSPSDQAMVKDDEAAPGTAMDKDDTGSMDTSDAMMDKGSDSAGKYTAYSQDMFDDYSGKSRVLFFHADWCPTCRALDKDISKDAGKLPQDLVLFKTDYDSEKELKKKYAVTYQHTFVQVDAQGNELTKWNGGGVDELVENVL